MVLELRGNLKKLSHQLNDNQVDYYFRIVEKYKSADQEEIKHELPFNQFLGKKISLDFLGEINCVACARAVKKSFNNGYCFPCLSKLAECDICIVKPELCHYDKGTCRDKDFATEYCNINHSLYLSLTSGLKIGVTRQYQEKSRWIDQGAVKAIRLLTLKRRYHAGLIEVKLAKQMADKTNWRKMLTNQIDEVDLVENRDRVLELIKTDIKANSFSEDLNYIFEEDAILENNLNQIQEISYPVKESPTKISSFNLDKDPHVEGILLGIKGQYLIFDTGVVNIRKYAGYKIKLQLE